MVIPLKKTTQEGEPYRRRTEIEQALSSLDGLAPDQLVERLTCTQQTLPFEVLIYFLRHTELELGAEYLEPIFNTFYGRLEAALRKVVSEAWIDHAVAIREELSERNCGNDCEGSRFSGRQNVLLGGQFQSCSEQLA